jgi:hypothetical protein
VRKEVKKMKEIKWSAKLFSVIPLLAMVLGCDLGETPQSSPPEVVFFASINMYPRGWNDSLQRSITYSANVKGSAIATRVSFKLNGLTADTCSYSHWPEYLITAQGTYFSFPQDSSTYHLGISSDVGDLEGDLRMPSPTSITYVSPEPPNYSFDHPQNITLTWEGDADFYQVYVDDDKNFDTITTAKSMTIPGSRINCAYRSLGISVHGFNGPLPVSGSKPNVVQGTNYGYFYAENSTGSRTSVSYYQTFGKAALESDHQLRDRRQARLQLLQKRVIRPAE